MLCLFVAVAAPLAGCGDDDAVVPPPGMDAGAEDAGVDSGGPPPPSTLFGPCVEDSQCPGDGAFCRLPADGWAMGYCTLPCMDRAPCDDGIIYNHCVEQTDGSGSFCERRCLNGFDCSRDGYTCIPYDPSGGTCISICSEEFPCGAGADCNSWSGACVPEGTVPTEGGVNGDSCGASEECRSERCILDPDWPGGYCYGFCILPLGYNSNTLFNEDTLPEASCPTGDVCFPNDSLTRGDLGVCFLGCTSDADCRAAEGYGCRQSWELASGETRTFTNGICVPGG